MTDTDEDTKRERNEEARTQTPPRGEETDTQCSCCGSPICNGDLKWDTQQVPYGDTTTTEHIVIGYKCHECGHEEDF